MAKSRYTLLQELNASIRSAGQGGKTTALDLRQFLGSLIDEILARPGSEPVGVVKIFAGATPPLDWALCDGSLLPVAQYADLYAVLGTLYGGDGATTFALPDLRGRFALGADGTDIHPLGQKGGTDNLTLSVEQLPAHNHQIRTSEMADDLGPYGDYPAPQSKTPAYGADPSSHNMAPDAITSTGMGAAIPILPPFIALHYIICLGPSLPDAATSLL